MLITVHICLIQRGHLFFNILYMHSFNKVMILGHLTADPQFKATKTGVGMTRFSVATNRGWKDKEGNSMTETHFHKVVAFGKLGETIGLYFKKGTPILLSGRLSTRSYAGKDGVVRNLTEIIVEDFNFVPFNKGSKTSQTREADAVSPQHEDRADAALESAEAELAEDLARKFTFKGAKLEEVVDY